MCKVSFADNSETVGHTGIARLCCSQRTARTRTDCLLLQEEAPASSGGGGCHTSGKGCLCNNRRLFFGKQRGMGFIERKSVLGTSSSQSAALWHSCFVTPAALDSLDFLSIGGWWRGSCFCMGHDRRHELADTASMVVASITGERSCHRCTVSGLSL